MSPPRESSAGASAARASLEEQLESTQRLLHALAQVHADYITHGDHRALFERLLSLMVELSRSGRGFIAELRSSLEETASLQLLAAQGWKTLPLKDLEAHVAHVLRSGAAQRIPDPGSTVESPPELLALPFMLQDKVVGVVGLGPRMDGDDTCLVDFLQPVLTTCGTLLHAQRETERRHLNEQALLAQQAQLRKLALVAARTDNAVIITDARGDIEWVNEGFTRITGYTLQEVLGQKPGTLLQGPGTNPKDIEAMRRSLSRAEGITVELLNYGKSGKPYWNLIEIQPVHDEQGTLVQFVAIESDVTARRQLEQQAAESTELLRLAMESTADGIWDWDLPSGILKTNARWMTMLGYEPAPQTTLEFWSTQLCHPEDLPEVNQRLNAHIEGRTPMFEYEHRLRHKDGHYLWILGRAKVIARDAQGKALRIVGTNVDVTSRKRAEEQLQAFIQAIPDMLFRVRRDGVCLAFKESLIEPPWRRPEEFIGKNLFRMLPKPVVASLQAALERVCQDSSLEIFEYSLEQAFGIQQFEARVVPIGPDEGMCIVRNITVRKALEDQRRRQREELEERVRQATRELESRQAQLIQSEKLASLGQMAASIAHEINNPVGFVSSNISTLGVYTSVLRRLIELYQQVEEHLGSDIPDAAASPLEEIRALRRQERLEEILQDTDELLSESREGMIRIREFIQDLKTFVREEAGTAQQADLNKLLQVTLRMLRHELKYKTQVRLDFGPLPLVRCYPTQLNQVFVNLLVNAVQAIEQRGEIHITTRREGNDVVIRIKDSGRGMSPETKARLFTPFFTTKPAGEGTGLGLSICYAIINRHKGRIEVDSELGRGTTFSVHVPLVEA
ncbi:PAS domain-containing sensor histidine kinase [Hyalangium minutum]|uniref:histidine kinase n=1 Tax=Hyalangium minutum TaxID=394096 RepID=A0A085WKH5_9BACT|nr:PAS domain S-box protein [Hyalangium minutum]KFE68188.1 Histidine kinase [Hyalangium minutum]